MSINFWKLTRQTSQFQEKLNFLHELLWKILKTRSTFAQSKTPVNEENFNILKDERCLKEK